MTILMSNPNERRRRLLDELLGRFARSAEGRRMLEAEEAEILATRRAAIAEIGRLRGKAATELPILTAAMTEALKEQRELMAALKESVARVGAAGAARQTASFRIDRAIQEQEAILRATGAPEDVDAFKSWVLQLVQDTRAAVRIETVDKKDHFTDRTTEVTVSNAAASRLRSRAALDAIAEANGLVLTEPDVAKLRDRILELAKRIPDARKTEVYSGPVPK